MTPISILQCSAHTLQLQLLACFTGPVVSCTKLMLHCCRVHCIQHWDDWQQVPGFTGYTAPDSLTHPTASLAQQPHSPRSLTPPTASLPQQKLLPLPAILYLVVASSSNVCFLLANYHPFALPLGTCVSYAVQMQ